MIVTAVGQIGCIPYQLARYNGSGSRCNEEINSAIILFNTGLRQLVDRFNKGVRGARFVYLDSYFSSQDLVQKAAAYGMMVNYLLHMNSFIGNIYIYEAVFVRV